MFNNFFLLLTGAFLVGQICHADPTDDAADALTALRQIAIDNLNAGFDERDKMAQDVETAAFDTKGSVLALIAKVKTTDLYKPVQKLADDLDACVNKQVDEALNLILEQNSDGIGWALKSIYDEEKQIIVCGKANTDCLTGVTDDINKMTDEFVDTITGFLEEDRQKVDDQIDMIKACAAAAAKML